MAEEFCLNEYYLNQVLATVVLTFHYSSRNSGNQGLPRKQVRKYCGVLINNPPGTREIREEEEGKNHIPKGHFPNGRNH